ncbi:MAG: hypothetical protein ACLR2E_03575 [Lachnospiraceae bacterium]
MIEVLVLGQTGHFAMSQPLLCELYVVTAFLTVMAYWKHRGNIVRLLHGEERKTYLPAAKIKNNGGIDYGKDRYDRCGKLGNGPGAPV